MINHKILFFVTIAQSFSLVKMDLQKQAYRLEKFEENTYFALLAPDLKSSLAKILLNTSPFEYPRRGSVDLLMLSLSTKF